jgi:hypothetical protein
LLTFSLGATSAFAGAFSLSASETVPSGAEPRISVYAPGVLSLEFRVYRVDEPVGFLENLADPQRFEGGRPQGTPEFGETTFLERVRAFKKRVYREFRAILRAQYQKESRARVRERQKAASRRVLSPAEAYAAVPLLNPQRLVSVFREPLSDGGDTVTIPVKDRGLYVVEATDGEDRAFTLVMVSDMVAILKSSPGQALVFVVDRSTGLPISGATARFLVRGGTSNAASSALSAVSDPSGLVRFETPPSDADDFRLIVSRADGSDFAAVLPAAWSLRDRRSRELLGTVYTDRPVYRPGHEIQWRAILRERTGDALQRPRADFRVEIQDSEGETIHRVSPRLTEFGTLSGGFTLPKTAPLGAFQIVVRDAAAGDDYDRTVSGWFNVEEYRKPEYDVKVEAQPGRVLQGETVRVVIDARYFFGEPVSGAAVAWSIQRSPYWHEPPEEREEQDGGAGFSEEGDAEADGDESQDASNSRDGENTGTLDENGRLAIEVKTRAVTIDPSRSYVAPQDVRYRVVARVRDASGREVEGAAAFIATYGRFVLSADLDRYLLKPGEPARLTVKAQDYEGRARQTAFVARLLRDDGRSSATTEVLSVSGATSAAGDGAVSLSIQSGIPAGPYRVEVSAVSDERRVSTTTYAWASTANDDGDFAEDRGVQIQLVPDKKRYAPGDIARVLVSAGVTPEAVLVTREGRSLKSAEVVRPEGETFTIDIPVHEEHAPNLFVGVAFVHRGQLFSGQKSLSVPSSRNALQVTVEPEKPQFRPDEPARYTITARDASGSPVTAEFSLGVVDEAIYSVRPDATGDPRQAFYGRVWNSVQLDSSMSYPFWGESGKDVLRGIARSRTLGRPERLSQVKGGPRLVQPRVRKAFPDTAYWVAGVRTGADGRARVTFKYPDSLTTWRATARGVTGDDLAKVGAARVRSLLRKNVIARLTNPRFLRVGDEATLAILGHNYLDAEKGALMSLSFTGIENASSDQESDLEPGESVRVSIPSRGDAEFTRRVVARKSGEARLLGKVLTDEESDATEMSLPVWPSGVRMQSGGAGVIEGSGEWTLPISFAPDTDPDSRRVVVDVSPSLAGSLFGGLDYLATYPYGCTEQTLSSFFPNIVVKDAAKTLGLRLAVSDRELGKRVAAGLQRIASFQHADGGWGFWETDGSTTFMTAYAVEGLSAARSAGYAVDASTIARGRDWLTRRLSETAVSAHDRVYATFALRVSAAPDEAVRSEFLDAAYATRSSLDPQGLAYLGLALSSGPSPTADPRVADVIARIEALAKTDAAGAYWMQSRDEWLLLSYDTSVEATALALRFLVATKPESALLAKAAAWLARRRSGGYWISTKQTAMAILGLTPYLAFTKELNPRLDVEVRMDGEVRGRRSFGPREAVDPSRGGEPIVMDLSGRPNAALTVRATGQGRTYVAARAESYSSKAGLESEGSLKLALTRQYFRLVPKNAGPAGQEKRVFALEPLRGPARVGDILAVRLTVTGDDARYLMIEDPLPAGTEGIDRDDDALYRLENAPPWWTRFWTRREIRDDRVLFFDTQFTSSVAAMRERIYLLKVTTPGRFVVSPARAEPMYQPGFRATSDRAVLEVLAPRSSEAASK